MSNPNPEQFWTNWINSNCIEKLRLTEKLAQKIDTCRIIEDTPLRLHCIASLLNSYFEDLYLVTRKTVLLEIRDELHKIIQKVESK